MAGYPTVFPAPGGSRITEPDSPAWRPDHPVRAREPAANYTFSRYADPRIELSLARMAQGWPAR